VTSLCFLQFNEHLRQFRKVVKLTSLKDAYSATRGQCYQHLRTFLRDLQTFLVHKIVYICGLSGNYVIFTDGIMSLVNYGKKSVVGNIAPGNGQFALKILSLAHRLHLYADITNSYFHQALFRCNLSPTEFQSITILSSLFKICSKLGKIRLEKMQFTAFFCFLPHFLSN
jgi:hypothetical protein